MELRNELGQLARLAAPVVIVQCGIMLLGVVDSMMLGRVSKEALAAAGLGSALSYAVFGGLAGMLYALDPLVAQDFGAGNFERVGRHLQRGLVLAFVLSLLGAGLLPLLAWNLDLFRQSQEFMPLAQDYLIALIPGVLPLLWFTALRQTLQAMSLVRPAVIAIVACNLFNAVANYALVFGHFGLPRMEVVGSALATSASRWVMLIALLMASHRRFRGLNVSLAGLKEATRFRAHLELLRLGGPIAVHHSLEIWVFGAVGLMMGSLGALEFAGHQIALLLASLSFMIPLGIGGAAATRVGNALGRGDKAAAADSAKMALVLGGLVMALSALLFACFPRLLARAFTPDAEVITMAALLLPIAAVFQLADGLQAVSAGVLRGMADTARPALYALLGFWALGLPTGWFLAFRLDLGPTGLWWGLSAGLIVVAILLGRRILAQFKRPIEQLQLEVR